MGLRNSNAFVVVLTRNAIASGIDPNLLGLAVILDKPIIVVCPPGCKIPEKIAKVVDRFIELDPETKPEQLMQSVKEALLELGVITDQGGSWPPYDTEPSRN